MVDSPRGVVPLAPVEMFQQIATWFLCAPSQLTINLLGSPSAWGQRVSVFWRTVTAVRRGTPVSALHQQGGPPGLSWGSALGACGDPGAGGEDVPRLSRCFPCTHGAAGRDSTWRGRIRHRASERRRTLMGGRGQGRWCVPRGLRRARGKEMPGMPRRCPMPAAHTLRSPFAQRPRLDPRAPLCLQPGPPRGLPAPGGPAWGQMEPRGSSSRPFSFLGWPRRHYPLGSPPRAACT